MATASDYLYSNPINAPTDPSRGFADEIYINFTSGKKSLDDQLKEIDLANKQLALEQQRLMPTDYALQEFTWAKAAADREAAQAVFDQQYAAAEESRRVSAEQRAVVEAGYAAENQKFAQQNQQMSMKDFKFSRQKDVENMKLSKEQMALNTASESRLASESALSQSIAKSEEARAAELQPYTISSAKASEAQAAADLAKTKSATTAQDLANAAATKKANPVPQKTQYYTAPALGTAQQHEWAVQSQNNPGWKPPGASFNTPSVQYGAPLKGSGFDPTTGRWWYA